MISKHALFFVSLLELVVAGHLQPNEGLNAKNSTECRTVCLFSIRFFIYPSPLDNFKLECEDGIDFQWVREGFDMTLRYFCMEPEFSLCCFSTAYSCFLVNVMYISCKTLWQILDMNIFWDWLKNPHHYGGNINNLDLNGWCRHTYHFNTYCF